MEALRLRPEWNNRIIASELEVVKRQPAAGGRRGAPRARVKSAHGSAADCACARARGGEVCTTRDATYARTLQLRA
jgi:hypothetical protein